MRRHDKKYGSQKRGKVGFVIDGDNKVQLSPSPFDLRNTSSFAASLASVT